MQAKDSAVEPRQEASLTPLTKPQELDKVFDLLLFLISVVTSVFFQFSSTVVPLRVAAVRSSLTQLEISQEVDMILRFDLRMYFIPLFLLVSVWIINRLPLETRILSKRTLSEFCYSLVFAILAVDIYVLTLISFPFLEALGNPAILLIFLFQFIVTVPFVYYYEMPLSRKTDSRKWKDRFKIVWTPILQQAFMVSFATWIAIITIFVINLLPLISQ